MGKAGVAKRKMYRVLTWDCEAGEFTKQKRVREKNAGAAGLRRALRLLRRLGYEARKGDSSVSVELVSEAEDG